MSRLPPQGRHDQSQVKGSMILQPWPRNVVAPFALVTVLAVVLVWLWLRP